VRVVYRGVSVIFPLLPKREREGLAKGEKKTFNLTPGSRESCKGKWINAFIRGKKIQKELSHSVKQEKERAESTQVEESRKEERIILEAKARETPPHNSKVVWEES